MKHENQSGTGGWLGTRRSVVLLLFLAIVGVLLFHRTPGAPIRHSSLFSFAGVPVHALLHAWRSPQTRQRW